MSFIFFSILKVVKSYLFDITSSRRDDLVQILSSSGEDAEVLGGGESGEKSEKFHFDFMLLTSLTVVRFL